MRVRPGLKQRVLPGWRSEAWTEEQAEQTLELEGNTMTTLLRLVTCLLGAALVLKGLAQLSLLAGG